MHISPEAWKTGQEQNCHERSQFSCTALEEIYKVQKGKDADSKTGKR